MPTSFDPTRFRALGGGLGRAEDFSTGQVNPCLVIAEVAQAHDGSLGMAHAFIDAAARAGADAIKFQTHIAAAESSPAEPWRIKFSYQDDTRYQYWQRMEFSEAQWDGLRRHADEKGILFLSSPFSIEAAEMLQRIGVSAWKIASGEITNTPLIDCLIRTGSPILLSTGMSGISEIDGVVHRVLAAGNELTVMQCTSAYPCPPEKVGLNMLDLLRQRYGCGVGLSDHSGTIFAGLAAVTKGIDALEVHVTLSREMFGPDVPVSLTTAELAQMVEGIRFIERMKASPVDKDHEAVGMASMRGLFTKSLAAARPLDSGGTLADTDVVLRKPGTGIPMESLSTVLGKRLRRSVAQGELLSVGDFE